MLPSKENTNEPSPASCGSQPVAWAVMLSSGCTWGLCQDKWEAVAVCDAMKTNLVANGYILPLYRQPPPTLTDEERAALEYGIRQADEYDRLGLEDAKRAAIVFRGLLERLK